MSINEEYLKNIANIIVKGSDGEETIPTNEETVNVTPTLKVRKRAISCEDGHIEDTDGTNIVGDKIFYELILTNEYSSKLTDVKITDYLSNVVNDDPTPDTKFGIKQATLFNNTTGEIIPQDIASENTNKGFNIDWVNKESGDPNDILDGVDVNSKVKITYQAGDEPVIELDKITIPAHSHLAITYYIVPKKEDYNKKINNKAHVTYAENPAGCDTVEPSNEVAITPKKPTTPAIPTATKKAYSDEGCSTEIDEVLCGQKFYYKVSYTNNSGKAQNITTITDILKGVSCTTNKISVQVDSTKLNTPTDYTISPEQIPSGDNKVTIAFTGENGYALADQSTIEVIIPVTAVCSETTNTTI